MVKKETTTMKVQAFKKMAKFILLNLVIKTKGYALKDNFTTFIICLKTGKRYLE